MSDARHPACPVDEDVAWTLQLPDAEPQRGQGLVAGLRALWRHAIRESVDGVGEPTGRVARLQLGELDARGAVTIALAEHGNTVLLRLRDWLAGPKGVVVLDNLARAHARLLLSSERWIRADPPADAESLAPLTVASILGDPDALIRALKPGH